MKSPFVGKIMESKPVLKRTAGGLYCACDFTDAVYALRPPVAAGFVDCPHDCEICFRVEPYEFHEMEFIPVQVKRTFSRKPTVFGDILYA